MRRMHVGKRARWASVALLVVLLGSLFAAVNRGSLEATWDSLERAQEHNALRKGVPQSGTVNETEDILERAQWAYNRLAYPAGKIPPGWRNKAKEHNRQNVKNGADLATSSAGTASLSAAGFAAESVQPVGTTGWTAMGPAPIDNNAASGGYKYGLVSGRINALAVDPTNPAVAYAGATAGGLWKTTNCCSSTNTTWTPLWSTADSVIQSVGAIKIDPTNSQVIYVGTGDFDAADQFGEGIMKTTDGGATWTQLGADVFTPYAAGTPDKPEQNVGVIEVDPAHPATVIAGTRHGFFMSYNGGATWSRFDVHGKAGQSQRVSSIVLDTSNPTQTTMYVAVGYPYTSKLYGNIGGGNGVYKATIPTAGAPSFTLLNSGWPTGTGGGTSNAVGRIRLAMSKQNSQLLYAQVSDYTNTNALGTWVTTNGGAAWTQLTGSADTSYKNCSNQATGEGQDWYDLFIGVDPANDKTLYIGRTSLYKATVNSTYTGFSGITDLANVYATSCAGYGSIHPDQHAVAMLSSTQFLVGNDGGLFLGSGTVGGFQALNKGMDITQFYAGQLGASFASSSTQYAFGGAQDNGSESWDASNTTPLWQARGNGGDGFFASFDPIGGSLTAGNWYTEYTYGDLDCSTTGARGAFGACRGGWYNTLGQQVDRSDWSTPFTLDQLHCTAASCKDIILGTYRLWTSGTGGTARSAWTAVSPDLTKGNVTTDIAANTIIDVRYAPSSPSTAAVGTDDGNVQWSNNIYTGTACTQAAANTASFACTPNASATWVNLTKGNAVLPNRAIQGVGFDPTNSQVVYAAVGGFNTNTPSTPGHLFQASCAASCTTAASWTWVDKTSNLGDIPAMSVIVNPNNAKQVFLGTMFGFYYTNDITAAAPVWNRFQNNLPNTIIQYLTVDRGATTLGAFTYGRSLYTIQLPGAGGFDPNATPTPTPVPATATPTTAPATATPTTAPATATPTTAPATATPTTAPATATPTAGPATATPTTTAQIAAPTNLTATAASKTRVTLNWKDNANNEGGYRIEQAVGSAAFADIGSVGANATSVTISVSRGKTYSYRVRAYSGTTYSGYSETATITMP